jgi:hypothetical protein
MEFVIVVYPTHRKVRIDGQDAGFTNVTLRVETGHHVFDLGLPPDYEPGSVRKLVKTTTVLDPLIVNDFHQGLVTVI